MTDSTGIIRATIIFACVVGIAFLSVYMSFFVVIVKGLIEENDEDAQLCKITHVTYRTGRWVVNGDNRFDEYAVLILTFGIGFLVMFGDFDLILESEGTKCGVVAGRVSQNVRLLRRKVRRE